MHLLLLIVAVLMVMIAATMPVLHAMEQRDRLRARIRTTTAPYQRQAAWGGTQSSGVALAEVSEGLGRRLAQLFGLNLAVRDQYRVPWWLALSGALIVAAALERAITLLVGPFTLIAVVPLWIMLSRSYYQWCESRRRDLLFNQFPDALSMIVRAVRIGIPVTDALRAVGAELPPPTGPEFARAADELGIGAVLEDTLHAMAERCGLPEYRFFATTLALQSQTGGGLSETLDNLADTIRKRVTVRKRGAALAAEAKTSATVLALLPPFAAAGLWFLSPQYIVVLVTDPTGKKVLGAAVVSLLCGIFTMRTMIRKSLS